MDINKQSAMLIGVIRTIVEGTPGCHRTPSEKLKEIKRYLDNPEKELAELERLCEGK
jgi:hypothetical protein